MTALKLTRWGSLSLILVFLVLTVAPALAQEAVLTDDMAVLPQALERISWGAILAGAVVALMTQLTLNLLAVAIGASTLNPADDESASAAEVGKGTVVSIGLVMLASLFVGGWMAARFAGTPERLDGLLHGLIVWGLVTLATMFLVTTTIGRILGGLSRLLRQGLRLAGSATKTVGGTVTQVAQDAIHTAGTVAHRAADGITRTVQTVAESPQAQQVDVGAGDAYERIRQEALDIIQRAGIDQRQVADTAQGAVQDIRSAAAEAMRKPGEVDRIIANVLGRLFNRGREVVNQVDRDAVVDFLVERGSMDRVKAEMTVAHWEQMMQDLPQQAAQTIDQVRAQTTQPSLSEHTTRAQNAIGEQVSRAQQALTDHISKVQSDLERSAREAAQSATDALAKLAMAAFIVVLIGAIAAGAGGYLGAPQELPVAEIDTTAVQP